MAKKTKTLARKSQYNVKYRSATRICRESVLTFYSAIT